MPLRTDILPDSLLQPPTRITVRNRWTQMLDRADTSARLRSVGPSKNIREVYSVLQDAIKDDEKRCNVANGLFFAEASLIETAPAVYEADPTLDLQTPAVTFSLVSRVPGAFGEGKPFESRVTNQRPMLREEKDDPENPGYKLAILGYYHDNVIRLTCWSRSNKEANELADTIEGVMERYSWFFAAQGIHRVLFYRRGMDQVVIKDGRNYYYGRPLDYFVRTETLWTIREKTIEEIVLEYKISSS